MYLCISLTLFQTKFVQFPWEAGSLQELPEPPYRFRIYRYCRLSLADKLKLFSGKKSTGKSTDSSMKSRRHLPRFQTQVTIMCFVNSC